MPALLDLYCGAGGASKGYKDAGFTVTGVDIVPQKHYPFTFIQSDAITYLRKIMGTDHGFVAVHASPPCQAFTKANRVRPENLGTHPDLIEVTRALLALLGLPFVIENVPGAPLVDPHTLCGAMFPPLRVYRHRLFEVSGFRYTPPAHPKHVAKQVKMGRWPQPGEFHQPVGNFCAVDDAREAMGVPWMVRNEIREAIPPAFTEHIGRQLLPAT